MEAVLGLAFVAAALWPAAAGASPFSGQGMWIWYVSASSGGDLSRIAAKAERRNITTLFVKSADGTSPWSQFNPSMIRTLHRDGLRVCAWQFVYGVHPGHEAALGAAAATDGADCLVIDAESDYEGRYASASRYVYRLRKLVGDDYPVALAGFPYVDYHPGFPYSVFLGPGAAQFNAPQLYWHTIGTTVAGGFAHMFEFNRAYRRPLTPLGQTYAGPPLSELRQFRRYALSYGFLGISWWDWQETAGSEWQALGASEPPPITGFTKPVAYPPLARGSAGDLVVWAQEHLNGAGEGIAVDGAFGGQTRRAVRAFQAKAGLPVTGALDAASWRALLKVTPRMVHWWRLGSKRATAPSSAALPALRNEIQR